VTEQITEVMTAPDRNGRPTLPRWNVSKGIIPTSWHNRAVRVAYVDGDGVGPERSATLLDSFPFGPVLNIAGAMTIVAWDAIRLIELTGA
jgi:hypothetical protein